MHGDFIDIDTRPHEYTAILRSPIAPAIELLKECSNFTDLQTIYFKSEVKGCNCAQPSTPYLLFEEAHETVVLYMISNICDQRRLRRDGTSRAFDICTHLFVMQFLHVVPFLVVEEIKKKTG